MASELTTDEFELLESLIAPDGWPLMILAPRDAAERASFQATSLSLLRKGLVEVYGRPEDASGLPIEEAAAILREPERWEGGEGGGEPIWFIRRSATGDAVIASGD